MRRLSRVLLLSVFVIVIGLVVIPTALSTQVAEIPEYDDQVSGWPAAPEAQWVPVDTPFYLLHGWANVDGTYPRGSYSVHMFLDGVELEPTFVGCVGLEPEPGTHCRNFLWDFPDGIETEGTYELVGVWMAPCGAMSVDGQYPTSPLSDFEIESCVDDSKSMAHPDLVSRKTLVIGDAPEVSLTPVEWFIYLDEFGPGVHSVFTVVEARPLSEEDIDGYFGFMEWWDEETTVGLCTVHLRDAGDDFVHIGDGYSTGEGCDPPAMQGAFDGFGLPDNVCVGVAAHGTEYQYCAPLNIEEPPPEVPNVLVQYPSGDVYGFNFVFDADGFEYLADTEPDGWVSHAGGSEPDGFIGIGDVAASLVAGDWLGIRHVGDEQEATFQIVDIHWTGFDGDTASGEIAAPFSIGDGIYVCWENGEAPPLEESGCVHTDIDDGTWTVNGLGLDPTWTVFTQYHDAEGDIQENFYTPGS
ncbi:MAG: hypothetical protein ACR2N7_05235 [Acidimicrobiia bacterium]